jgi:hypothetical protein
MEWFTETTTPKIVGILLCFAGYFIQKGIKRMRSKRRNKYGVPEFRNADHEDAVLTNEKFGWTLAVLMVLIGLCIYIVVSIKHAF